MGVLDGKFYVFGGTDGTNSLKSMSEIYDPGRTNGQPVLRSHFMSPALAVNGEILLIGGTISDTGQHILKNIGFLSYFRKYGGIALRKMAEPTADQFFLMNFG